MSGEQGTINSKKRDASYYRDYRRKKKAQMGSLIPFPQTKRSGRLSAAEPYLILKTVVCILFVALLTGLLIYLSVPFYLKTYSPLMAYTIAASVELSLVFLISLKVHGFFERTVKHLLVVALSLYALLPIALNPIFDARKQVSVHEMKNSSQEAKLESLKSEIRSRNNNIPILMERGRITAAQLELQSVAHLEGELRNTLSMVQPKLDSKIELQSSYLVALQRLLLMLCNLFFVHHLVGAWRGKRKLTHPVWRSGVAFGCTT